MNMFYLIVSVVVILAFLANVSEAEVTEPNPPSDGSIDVLIISGTVSCVSKAVLRGLRQHMSNVGTLHFVVPTFLVLECRTMEDVICHDENQILNWERSWVPKNRHGWSPSPARRGWCYQQLVKILAFQRIPLTSNFVLWDADNVLIRDYAPFQGTQSRFLTSGDHGGYNGTTYALIGTLSGTRTDVVVH